MTILKAWTNNKFAGHWPVGTAAVVIAETDFEAASYLQDALKEHGLPQKVDPKEMTALILERGASRILCDGDY